MGLAVPILKKLLIVHWKNPVTKRAPGPGQMKSWTQKMRGHSGQKLLKNREIVVGYMVGVVGSHGQLTHSAILRNPRTKYKRSKIVFSFTAIALSCAHICARLLQPLAQSQ